MVLINAHSIAVMISIALIVGLLIGFLYADNSKRKALTNFRIDSLSSLTNIQCSDGMWNYDSYNHGMANGMLLILAAAQGKEPLYLDAPNEWIADKRKKTGEVKA